MTGNYAVIQYGIKNTSIVYGIGTTKAEALADASNYTDAPCIDAEEHYGKGNPDDYTAVYDRTNGGKMVDGGLYLVRCSEELADAVGNIGGTNVRFEIDAGYAYRPEDIEGY